MSTRSSYRFAAWLLPLACAGMFLGGCKKDSSPTGPGGGAGSVVNVTGKVVGLNGQPASGLPVFVTGKASVNTDANGAFAIASVTTPYDITVIIGSLKQAYIYRGLSRTDPTLMFVGATAGTANTATISGKIYPASAFPQPANRVTYYAFIAPELSGQSGSANGAVSPATYTQSLSWYGAANITGTLYALQWDVDAANLPTTYQRFGLHSGVAVSSGGTFSTVNDTMNTSPGTLTLSGSVTVPAGYTVGGKILLAQFGGRTAFSLLQDNTSAATFSYKTPDISGFTVELEALAGKVGVGETVAFRSGVSPSAAGATISVPAAPELSLPVDGATGVKTGAPFSWNVFSGGIHVLSFDGPTNQPDIFIMTAVASDSLPNLTNAGMPVPASTNYGWRVIGFAPFASMDAATGSNGFLPGGFALGATEGTGSMGLSAARNFTTAP